MTRAADILQHYDELRADHEAFYLDLHQHPELSFKERQTAAKLAARLRGYGFEVTEGLGGTGVVGTLENGSGPHVAIRADMDALPVTERGDHDYKSTVRDETPDGEVSGVMHACGHDTHMSSLDAAVHLMSEHRDVWSGTLTVVYQPAEEIGQGARAMVDDDVARLLKGIDVYLGQHILPRRAGEVHSATGAVMAASDSVRVTIHGRGGHGSTPHQTIDPIVIGSAIVMRLQTVVSREIAPQETAVVTVGAFHAGTKANIIPDTARLTLNMRSYSETTRTRMHEAVTRIVRAECQAAGAPEPEIEFFDQVPITINDDEAAARVGSAFAEHFGERHRPFEPMSASEDFTRIATALGVPSMFWGYGGIPADRYDEAERSGRIDEDVPGLHSAQFVPAMQPTLETAVEAAVVAMMAYLSSAPEGEHAAHDV